ncbi:MAG: SLC13 family permease [Pseudohongiellaceae bacterium]
MEVLEVTLNTHAMAVMILTVIALVMFTNNKLPMETSSLFILVILTVGFYLFPYSHDGAQLDPLEFYSGFGHEALVAVTALMVIGHGLTRTGALEPVGRMLAKLWGIAPALSFLMTLLIGAVLSAFVNNVPIVILLLPILMSVSLRTKTSPSGILMPMGFATLIGGMGTTIGTSTNLLVVSVAVSMGMREFSMFEFFMPVAMSSGIAILYLWLIAPRLLPKRQTDLFDPAPRIFSAALHVTEESKANGLIMEELIKITDEQIKVNYIRRGGDDLLSLPHTSTVLQAGDQLLVKDTAENLKVFEKQLGTVLYASDKQVDDDHPLMAEDQKMAELIVTQGSVLERISLTRSRFADRYQLITLAIHRGGLYGRNMVSDISNTNLQVGDVLLVQGDSEKIAEMKKRGDVVVLDSATEIPHSEKAPYALAIMVAVVTVAAFGILPIAVSSVAGVLLLALTKCLGWKEMAQALNAQIILIVAASLALGSALLETGAADALAVGFVNLTMDSSVTMKLSGLMLLMAVLTNIVSNNAAAVIGTPIAIGIANQLALPIEPFVLAVLFGANMSFATPMAYKTNLLVMTVGGYTFKDFLKVGIPLTLIMWISLSWLIPVFYQIS